MSKGYYACTPCDLLDQFATYDPSVVDKWIEKKKGL
jgi:hypothetical protein